MKKTGFKDALAVKTKKDGNFPWSAKAPHYDERSSCYMSQGDNYGVGHKTPVGKEKASGYAVPVGRPNTLHIYDDKIDLDE